MNIGGGMLGCYVLPVSWVDSFSNLNKVGQMYREHKFKSLYGTTQVQSIM